MKRFFASSLATPLAFLAVCIAAYGLLIPWLGFYWDDWPFLWFAHTLGPEGLIEALAGDRPFLAAIYMFTTSLLGEQPLAWQIFAIFTRWLMTLALWWSLLQVWPSQRRVVTWVALTFAVFPGFQQSWISVIYSQAFLLLAAFLLSLGMMVKAVRTAGWRSRRYLLLTVAALLLSAFAFFSTEYFFGIELVRPLLILFVLAESAGGTWRRQIGAALAHWAPYLAEFVLFFLYRIFLSPHSAYPVTALDQLSTSLPATLWDLFKTALVNAFTASWAAWTQTFSFLFSFDLDWNSQTIRLFVGVVLLSLALLLFVMLRLAPKDAAADTTQSLWSRQAMLLGGFALLAASLPFWAGGLPLSLTFPYDRFNLAMMFGASLLLVGALEYFIRTLRQKIVLLALVISLAIGFQFRTANTFRRDWQNMQELMWQVTWRMPALEPGTMLLTHEFPLKYYSDNSLSAVINWIYAPENHTRSMPLILNYIKVRLGGSLPGLEPNLPLSQPYRAMRFTGSTSDSVVLLYTPPGCLRVVDETTTQGNLPAINNTLLGAARLTNFERIIANPATPARPPERWFGDEPINTWCYYFEKADLARQQNDWQSVAALGREALDKNRKPGDSSEWLVFLEGFARSGDWEQAVALGARMMQNDPRLKEGVCQAWKELLAQASPDEEARATVINQQAEIGCTPESQP